MASEKMDEIIARHSILQSLSPSDLEDSLERNICHTQAMQLQIAHEMSKIQQETSTASCARTISKFAGSASARPTTCRDNGGGNDIP